MTERGSAHAIGLHCDCAQWHAVTTANVAVPEKRRCRVASTMTWNLSMVRSFCSVCRPSRSEPRSVMPVEISAGHVRPTRRWRSLTFRDRRAVFQRRVDLRPTGLRIVSRSVSEWLGTTPDSRLGLVFRDHPRGRRGLHGAAVGRVRRCDPCRSQWPPFLNVARLGQVHSMRPPLRIEVE
jgi:hypothetical protein